MISQSNKFSRSPFSNSRYAGDCACPLQEVLDRKRSVYKQLQKIGHQNMVKLIKYVRRKNKCTNQELGSKGRVYVHSILTSIGAAFMYLLSLGLEITTRLETSTCSENKHQQQVYKHWNNTHPSAQCIQGYLVSYLLSSTCSCANVLSFFEGFRDNWSNNYITRYNRNVIQFYTIMHSNCVTHDSDGSPTITHACPQTHYCRLT